MAKEQSDNSLYPIAVLIDELRNDDVKVTPGSLNACTNSQSTQKDRNGHGNLSKSTLTIQLRSQPDNDNTLSPFFSFV